MAEDIDVQLGKRLRRRRRALGMTQTQLAEAVGITFQQVQKYECAHNRITAARLAHFIVVLKVTPSYFFEDLCLSMPGLETGRPERGGADACEGHAER